jgi:hypothetical protein
LQFLNGTENNIIAKWMIDSVAESLPADLIHPCPYFGRLRMINITLDVTNIAMQFLKGSYITSVRLFDKKDENIVTFNLKTEFVTRL